MNRLYFFSSSRHTKSPSQRSHRGHALFIQACLSLVVALASITPALAADRIAGVSLAEAPADLAAAAPDLNAQSGTVIAPDGRELWARDSDTRRAMASTTKIMTAVVVLENATLTDEITVSSNAASVGESSSGLSVGDTMTVEKMLEALLVKSGNDAAIVLAEHVAGSEDGFVEMMNAKADDLGLADTRYQNPHGLDEANHFTTARDLAVLAQFAMGNDDFRRVVALEETTISGRGGDYTLESSNLLLGELEGANGIKTGWTGKAGYCLVASAERSGIELIAVVLGSRSEQSRFDEAEELLNWGFSHYGYRTLASAEETLATVPVSDYLDVDVDAVLAANVTVPVFDLDGDVTSTLALQPSVRAPVVAGVRLGTLTLVQGQRLLAQVPVVAGGDVASPGMFERMWISIVRLWRGVFGEPGTAPAPA